MQEERNPVMWQDKCTHESLFIRKKVFPSTPEKKFPCRHWLELCRMATCRCKGSLVGRVTSFFSFWGAGKHTFFFFLTRVAFRCLWPKLPLKNFHFISHHSPELEGLFTSGLQTLYWWHQGSNSTPNFPKLDSPKVSPSIMQTPAGNFREFLAVSNLNRNVPQVSSGQWFQTLVHTPNRIPSAAAQTRRKSWRGALILLLPPTPPHSKQNKNTPPPVS